MSETVILCEGYHDRAFWKGWLKDLGCTDPGLRPGTDRRAIVRDPFGDEVKGGQFAYHSKSKQFIRIWPCNGKESVLKAARVRLKQRASKALARLVINVDPDVNPTVNTAATGFRIQDALDLAQDFDNAAVLAGDEIHMDGAKTRVALVRWDTDDAQGVPGVPDQQTLERLICAAINAAFPIRGQNVEAWLRSRDQPPGSGVKEYAWSFMAGWYANRGCENFYSNLWSDASIRSELQSRLTTSGAWAIAENLAS